MNEQTARRLARSIAVFSVLLVFTGLVLSILALIADGQGIPFSHQVFRLVLHHAALFVVGITLLTHS